MGDLCEEDVILSMSSLGKDSTENGGKHMELTWSQLLGPSEIPSTSDRPYVVLHQLSN